MVLFNRLFGHKKKQNTPSVSDAIEQLRGTQNILMKKHDFLEAKIATVSSLRFGSDLFSSFSLF